MPLKMQKMIWCKFTSSCFTNKGRYREEHVTNLVKNPNVDQEYVEALRTKSYLEICYKVQRQLERKSCDVPSSSSSSASHHVLDLSEFVLEPQQDSLNETIKICDHHHLLVNYFENSLEAWKVCELLLRRIHQARVNHRAIKRVLKLMRRASDGADWSNGLCNAVNREFTSLALLENPFSTISNEQFLKIHDGHVLLLHKLTSKCRKIRRRAKIIRFFEKGMASILAILCCTLAITLLILAVHSMVGMVAAPSLVVSSCLLLKKFKQNKQTLKTTLLERLEAQLDVAAKGVYIVINDFDTISRLVRRLCDEVDHNKSVADMCKVKGNKEMMKKIAKEFQINETRFLEQLEELEERLYLCFLNINRSRKLVMEKVVGN